MWAKVSEIISFSSNFLCPYIAVLSHIALRSECNSGSCHIIRLRCCSVASAWGSHQMRMKHRSCWMNSYELTGWPLELLAFNALSPSTTFQSSWRRLHDSLILAAIKILSRVPGCVVVWLVTLYGLGLDTGFIHSGDLQLHTLQV
jgi:hypothetical protein